MLVEMDKAMLASLVRGMDPAYEIMDDPLIKTKGYYSGGHSDRWNWNYGFEYHCPCGCGEAQYRAWYVEPVILNLEE